MKLKWLMTFLLIVCMSAWSHALFYSWRCFLLPTAQTTIVMIPKGSSLKAAGRILQDAGVVENAARFVLLGKLLKKTNAIHWGEYELQAPAHPIEILNILVAGKIKLYTINIPEGFNLQQIAAVLEVTGLIKDKHEFINYALSPQAVNELGVPGPTLEGYLFPTTYEFWRGITPTEVGREMVLQYHKIIKADWRRKAQALGMNERQWITLASIIEKETGEASERPEISAVYHNRLKKKMRLQADPTVIYGIADFNGNLTRKNLETYSPYNTYVISGLPPGPIANPGAAAIEAALYPSNSDALYFVANGNGTHLFSKTYEEHQKNVVRYQLRPRSKTPIKQESRTDRSVTPPQS
jgi:UPF0755 protein